MFSRQHKTFWYQFCNFKHFLKAENSEDIFGSSCAEKPISLTCTSELVELTRMVRGLLDLLL